MCRACGCMCSAAMAPALCQVQKCVLGSLAGIHAGELLPTQLCTQLLRLCHPCAQLSLAMPRERALHGREQRQQARRGGRPHYAGRCGRGRPAAHAAPLHEDDTAWFLWAHNAAWGVPVARAMVEQGGPQQVQIRLLHWPSSDAAAFISEYSKYIRGFRPWAHLWSLASCAGGLQGIAWRPPLIRHGKVCPAVSSVGLGNRLFSYCVHRLLALVWSAEFQQVEGGSSMGMLECRVDYRDTAWAQAGPGAASSVGIWPGMVQQVASARTAAEVRPVPGRAALTPSDALCCASGVDDAAASRLSWPMATLCTLTAATGRLAMQTMPGMFAAGPLLQSVAGVVATWLGPLIAQAVAESRSAASGLKESDWAVHVRCSDIWKIGTATASAPGYTQPPAWWHAQLARQHKPDTVWICTDDAHGEYTQAVIQAWRLAGCTVHLQAASVLADLGTLMRAGTLVGSMSTFSWWAALLAPYVERSATFGSQQCQVHWPEVGAARAASWHGRHTWLQLSSAPALAYVAGDHVRIGYAQVVTTHTLPIRGDWRGSATQRAELLKLEQ